MTGTEEFVEAWKLVVKEENYSFVGKIYRRDYLAVVSITGIEVNLVADKEAYLALVEHLIITPAKIVDEGNSFLYIHRHSNYREVYFYVKNNYYHLQIWENNYPKEYWG